MLSIVVIVQGAGAGTSVANVAIKQANELAKSMSVSVISDHTLRHSSLRQYEIQPYKFSWLRRLGHVPREVSFALAACRAVKKMLRSGQVDLIVCHSHVVALHLKAAIVGLPELPVVLVTHGVIFDRPRQMYGEPLTTFYKFVTPIAHKRSNAIIALSPKMAELCIRYGADASSVRLLPNGLDSEEIGLTGTSEYQDVPVLRLGFFGRLSMEKGADILIKALAVVSSRGFSVSLLIVGDGGERKALEVQAEELGLASLVTFWGASDRARLCELYFQVDVVCVPSRTEAFGLVAVEAMACGRPVIVSDVGGLPWIVGNSGAGIVYRQHCVHELVDAIELLALDPNRRRKMSEAAVQRAAKFEWRKIGMQLGSIVEEVASG